MAVFFFILLFRFAVPPPLFFFKRKKRGTARGQREAIDLSVARLWLLIVSVGGRCGTDFLLFLLFYSKTEKNNLKNQIKKLLSSTFFLSTRRHLVPLDRVQLLELLLLALLLRELSLQLFFCRGRGGRGVPASGRRRRRRRRRLWRELSLLVVVLAAASSSFFLLLLLLLVFREARDLDAELGLDRGLAGGELELDLVFGKRGSKEKRERDKVSVF